MKSYSITDYLAVIASNMHGESLANKSCDNVVPESTIYGWYFVDTIDYTDKMERKNAKTANTFNCWSAITANISIVTWLESQETDPVRIIQICNLVQSATESATKTDWFLQKANAWN